MKCPFCECEVCGDKQELAEHLMDCESHFTYAMKVVVATKPLPVGTTVGRMLDEAVYAVGYSGTADAD